MAKVKKYITEEEITRRVSERLAEILQTVDYSCVVTYSDKTRTIYIGGKQIPEAQALNLRSEAEFFKNTELYKLLTETKKNTAYMTMFEKSQSFEDMRFGKAMLYDISMDKKVMDIFTAYKPISKTRASDI